MSNEFETESDCVSFIERKLTDELESSVRATVSAALASCFVEDSRTPQKGFGVVVRRWVVKDDDLKLFEEFNRALIAAASANFLFDQAKLAAAGVGIGLAVLAVLRNIYRSGARLRQDDFAVLRLILDNRLTVAELLQKLHGDRNAEGDNWTDERVKETLKRLAQFPTVSGLKKFAAEDGSGRWGAEGI